MSLIISRLNKSFGDKVVFRDFSANLDDTGVYALVGESGAGKTTLLRMIAGLDKDYYGEIIGGGIGNVSFSFQEHRLFPSLSALHNVVLANHDIITDDNAALAAKMLCRLGIGDEDMKLFPSELSGGMKQRVSLARAFLRDAPILLLDEPTKELDAVNAEIVRQIIIENSEKRLVILVSHNDDDLLYLSAKAIKI